MKKTLTKEFFEEEADFLSKGLIKILDIRIISRCRLVVEVTFEAVY